MYRPLDQGGVIGLHTNANRAAAFGDIHSPNAHRVTVFVRTAAVVGKLRGMRCGGAGGMGHQAAHGHRGARAAADHRAPPSCHAKMGRPMTLSLAS